MKRTSALLVVIALLAIFTVAAAPASAAPVALATDALIPCPICALDLSQYAGPLNAAEINGLLKALNDEYHAWAVYDQVLQDFGAVRPFANIQRSEATHIAALVRLFNTYQLPVPANPWIGQAPHFASVREAAAAGVQAEILNVQLYDEILDSTTRVDIVQVYIALQRASQEQHLPAFQRAAR